MNDTVIIHAMGVIAVKLGKKTELPKKVSTNKNKIFDSSLTPQIIE